MNGARGSTSPVCGSIARVTSTSSFIATARLTGSLEAVVRSNSAARPRLYHAAFGTHCPPVQVQEHGVVRPTIRADNNAVMAEAG
jgi:hypothetical protein